MRNEVEIYTLLGRRAEAEEALRQALAADETTLETAAGTSEEADIHWSMAQTLEASGRLEAALGHAATACELTDERHLRRWIRRWASRSHGVRLAACDWTSIAG